ncbi:MAG: hypothetical protein COU90_03970 [Candidatus Ryanbacteria bacterium CG10_big_fil_rev_8_21_14_0_10_43_42]|uniref:Uncharacterized protein n=1 Tax=Candidatus Ryanbacteria bacterium CG10_big_fil_rev_8_21_14_0_10_43_42 TaxID=1974864 RepID=A0A2M8KWC0_9BACT|nr:MAG: hypothetical protein COU90_03970 [Candidatus Ryanbacteria bacterium CG10_big_fil_rev_8_21_14_0_10_43_42]
MAIKNIAFLVALIFLFGSVDVSEAGGRRRRNNSGRTAAFATIGTVLGMGLLLRFFNNNKREETERLAIKKEYEMQGKQAELNAALAAPNALGDNRETSTVDQTLPGRTILHAPFRTASPNPIPRNDGSLLRDKKRREFHQKAPKFIPPPPPPAKGEFRTEPAHYVQASLGERKRKPQLPRIDTLHQLRAELPLTDEYRNARLALSMGIEEVSDPNRAAYSKSELRAVLGNLKELQERRRSRALDDLVMYLLWAVR